MFFDSVTQFFHTKFDDNFNGNIFLELGPQGPMPPIREAIY